MTKKSKSHNAPKITEQIRQILIECDLTLTKIESEIGVSRARASKIRSDHVVPSSAEIDKIAAWAGAELLIAEPTTDHRR